MKFLRYIAVQFVAYGIDIGGFLVLFGWIGVDMLVANVVGKCLAGVFAYYAHHDFTFRTGPDARHGRQATRYVVLLGLNAPISTIALALLIRIIPSEPLAKLAADAACVVITYGLSKRFVFAPRHSDDSPATEPRR